MNSYIHLHKFHRSWVNPFMDQIVPHVCALLLLDKKKKMQLQLVSFSFEFKVSLVIYELREFHDLLRSNTVVQKWESIFLYSFLFQQCESFLKTFHAVPGLDMPPLHLSCYTVSIMPGEWTQSPVAMTKYQINQM